MVSAMNIRDEAVKSKAAGMASKSGLQLVLSYCSFAAVAPGDIGADVGFSYTFRAYINFFPPYAIQTDNSPTNMNAHCIYGCVK